MNFRRLHLPIVCIALAASFLIQRADGQEHRFDDANCAVTIPPDWENIPSTTDKPDLLLASFGTHDQRHRLLIAIYNHGRSSEPADRWFVDDMDREYARRSTAGRRVFGKLVEVAGLKGYERRNPLIVEGVRASSLVWAVPTGEGTYFLRAVSFDGEVENTPDVRQALASFRFLHPPPPVTKTRGAGQLRGLYLGLYGIPLLLIGTLIAAVLFIIGLCLRIKRHVRTATYAPHLSADGEPPSLPSTPADPPRSPYDY